MSPPHDRVPGEGLHEGTWPGPGDDDRPLVGVLALQGDVLENLRMLEAAGAAATPVKRPEELDALDGLVVPGGESTAIGKLADFYGLLEPLRKRVEAGLPTFGTCAGAILLAREALLADGTRSGQQLIGGMDTVVRRNAFGRQVASFEADIDVLGVEGGPLHAVFIRAPWIEEAGPEVEVLSRVPTPVGDRIVIVRERGFLASAFHPELSGDGRLHQMFVSMVRRGNP